MQPAIFIPLCDLHKALEGPPSSLLRKKETWLPFPALPW